MAAKKSKKHVDISSKNRFLKTRLEQVNNVFGRLEDEVESVFKKLVKQGERSSRDLKRNFDDILSRVRKTDFYLKAQETREDVEREVRSLADDVLGKVAGLQINPSHFTAKRLLKDGRKSLDALKKIVESSNILSKAKTQARETKNGILSALHIPTQHEVERLERKISGLEKKVQIISRIPFFNQSKNIYKNRPKTKNYS